MTTSLLAVVVATIAGCGQSGPPTASGKSLTVLEFGATYGAWNSLDPLTDHAASVNHDFFNAIYGGLFDQGANGSVIPDLATGYRVVNGGREVDITLRPGVKFSDGTPFDAAAVVFNLRRDLEKSAGCVCLKNFAAVSSITAPSDSQVALHLSRPDPAIVEAFISAAPNWIVSPTALRKLRETAFGLNPVGAGPFTVASDQLNVKLALKANPSYWHQGYPKLQSLTFTSVANDTSAYNAMLAGQAQVYMDFGTPALLNQMKQRFNVIDVPATQTEAINLSSKSAPFSNILAREAIYYATDPVAINKHIFDGAGTISQSPTGPGDLFWSPKVPGYRTYDLPKAKSLVKQLGGLSFTLTTLNTPLQLPLAEALASQWSRAGIKTKISIVTIPEAVAATERGSIQAIATMVGSHEPSLLPGLAFSYASTGPFSLVNDPALDKLIDTAKLASDRDTAAKLYAKVFAYLSEQAYAPFLFTPNLWNVAAKSVTGIRPDTDQVAWQLVSR